MSSIIDYGLDIYVYNQMIGLRSNFLRHAIKTFVFITVEVTPDKEKVAGNSNVYYLLRLR